MFQGYVSVALNNNKPEISQKYGDNTQVNSTDTELQTDSWYLLSIQR